MNQEKTNIKTEALKSYSSAFSRTVFSDIIKYQDFSHLDWLISYYDHPVKAANYNDYIKQIYKLLLKDYRCEYVYKNELLKYLLAKYGTKETVAFNEYKVGDSIVDIAFFNGESKAFEIKSDLDSPKRLKKQVESYSIIFDKCYVVIPENKCEEYLSIVDEKTGILLLAQKGKRLFFEEYKTAIKQEEFDSDIFIRCLRTYEYESVITQEFGELPLVPSYRMFDACKELFRSIPQERLRTYFVEQMKKRKSNMQTIKSMPSYLKQIGLSMNLNNNSSCSLLQYLNNLIIS